MNDKNNGLTRRSCDKLQTKPDLAEHLRRLSDFANRITQEQCQMARGIAEIEEYTEKRLAAIKKHRLNVAAAQREFDSEREKIIEQMVQLAQ